MAALSLLLCVATVVLWVRSYRTRDAIGWGWHGGNCHLAQSIVGRVHVLSDLDGGCEGGFSYSAMRLVPNPMWNAGMSSYPVKVEWHGPFIWQTYTRSSGFGFMPGGRSSFVINHHRLIVVPHWALSGLWAVGPAVWAVACVRRRRWAIEGRCAACGYDLTGNVSGVCPECGVKVEKSARDFRFRYCATAPPR